MLPWQIALYCSGSTGALFSAASTMLASETQGLALDFTDSFWAATTGRYGSAKVKDTGTPANNFDSIPGNLLSYTGTTKLTRQSDGVYRYGPHNLYVNSATPANQSITAVSGASYSVTITGSVSVTASGAATGTWTVGTTTFTASTTTLSLGSTSGSGTVHVRRTPSDSTYIATTAAAKYGLPFEWSAAGVLQGILVEPQATNVCTMSNTFSDAGWNVSGCAAVQNADGPFGTGTAWTVTASAGSTSKWLFRAVSSTNGVCSVYAKAGTTSIVSLSSVGIVTDGAYFNLATGSVGTVRTGSASMTAIGNGWYRCSWVPGAAVVYCVIGFHTADNQDMSWTAAGTETVLVSQCQVETGSVATSPIITYAASATRAADNISLATTAYPYLSTATTLFVVYSPRQASTSAAGFQDVIGIKTGGNDRLALFASVGPGTYPSFRYGTGTSAVNLNSTTATVAGATVKLGGAADATGGAFYQNGVQINTSGSAISSVASGTLSFGKDSGGTDYLNGYISKALVLPRRATNVELQTLTS